MNDVVEPCYHGGALEPHEFTRGCPGHRHTGLAPVIALCMDAEEQWKKHPFNHELHPEVNSEEHRPCETGSRVQFARRVMSALGFCHKCGESMPCTTCGAGL